MSSRPSCHTAGEISGYRPHLDKDKRKIHRHLHDLAQFKPVGRGLADEVVYVAHAQRVSRLFKSASKAALDAAVCVPPSMKGP